MSEECCEKCLYYQRLKHNFQKGTGFQESHACDVLMYIPDKSFGWIQEVEPQDRCEMFLRRKE